ncbi:MAG: hypothetical protein A2V92_00875 [Candidatus Muproteobacteria bacterium RBG_16_65_31]|uniref:EamA domain-containing protein n=2 Tax=Candidatus Muproteobacteria TaxID=1817795 RepID=A0A1F6TEE3_9PROT|nr:MAG: hypothetical protein A2V92_00875 [Candidatus Muproteobacteria bacterium RBG_16_65_31]
MKSQAKPALLIAMFIYLAWGLGLLFAPVATHKLLAAKPLGATVATTLGVALLAFAGLFLIAANKLSREFIQAAVAGLAVLGVAMLYLIFLGRNMPQNPYTVVTLIFTIGLAVDLFLTTRPPAHGRRPAPRGKSKRKKKARRR